MKKLRNVILISLVSVYSLCGQVIDLTSNNWQLWLDNEAEYWEDTPLLPPVNLSTTKVNEPTCGWHKLFSKQGKTVQLPATVEEHFCGANGNKFGLSGDYVGVSWFSTTFDVPANWNNKRIVLHFESVRMRAEVFVNGQLVGYDLIYGTPFDVDISKAIRPGSENKLAVRITDPDGNFLWIDFISHKWNKFHTPPSHGFGGITGSVVVEATDKSFIDDVFVKNKPQLDEVDIDVSLNNISEEAVSGEMVLKITPWKESGNVVFSQNISVEDFKETTLKNVPVKIENAKPWSLDNPNLYMLTVGWTGKDGAKHSVSKRFGFRWFEPKTIDGHRMFFLNGERIVLRSSISWGFWPVNGIYPTPELARKQIQIAKDLGLNMLNFHRGIGQSIVLDLADEMGLLYYQEPGGYKSGKFSEFTQDWNRERFIRMMKRDRSHPSLIIYNMINESNEDPRPHEYADIKLFQQVDPTRVITFTSTNLFKKGAYKGVNPAGVEAGIKLHVLPYDTTRLKIGWWDQHFPDGWGVYDSKFYGGPDKIHKGSDNIAESVMWGEDGALGTPHRLELIKKEIDKNKSEGWDSDSYLAQYEAYDDFLDKKGFRKAFPTVDALTMSLGDNAMFYQARIIENIRVNNTVDCYIVNGWEGEKVENHSGVVDIYRNPKGDPKIMAYYNQPLFVSIKARELVFETGKSTLVDFYVINEKNIQGKHELVIKATDASGEFFTLTEKVEITGGNVYGELLLEGIEIKPTTAGHCTISAEIKKKKSTVATGVEKIFTAQLDSETDYGKIAVVDTTGKLGKMLKEVGVSEVEKVKTHDLNADILFIHQASNKYSRGNMHVRDEMLEWVKRGHTLIVLKETDKMTKWLASKEIVDFRGMRKVEKNWYGGNYLVKKHPMFEGLPVNTAFNWEYMCLADYKKERYGLRIENGETVVAVSADHKPEMYTSVVIIPLGKGNIILSTLDLEKAILQKTESNIVAKKILQNYLKFAKSTNKFE